MKIYDSFTDFWNEFATEKQNSFNFHDWQPVQIVHTSDEEYLKQKSNGEDELGFQPLFVTVANPLNYQTRKYLVKNVTSEVASSFKEYCRQQYHNELGNRFGSFRPDQFKAFAEYDSWESFYKSWLERDGKPVFMHNIPLLFDHTPKIEYWTRKQTGQDVLPYQRLLVTTYFVNEHRFFDFFIKNIDDAEAEKIKLMTMSRIGLNLDTLYGNESIATHA